MDPVSLIMAALAAGVMAGAQGTATEAVDDAYASLKASIKRRFTRQPAGEVALEQHEKHPERWAQALEGELLQNGADTDEQTVAAARRVMELLDPVGTQSGRYLVDLRGAQGIQVGNRNTQHNTFGNPTPPA